MELAGLEPATLGAIQLLLGGKETPICSAFTVAWSAEDSRKRMQHRDTNRAGERRCACERRSVTLEGREFESHRSCLGDPGRAVRSDADRLAFALSPWSALVVHSAPEASAYEAELRAWRP
jgi:hypothetical protein